MSMLRGRLRITIALAACALRAETGSDAWLRYQRQAPAPFPNIVVMEGGSTVTERARAELTRGIRAMLGKSIRIESPMVTVTSPREPDAFWLRTMHGALVIQGGSDRGVLYGVFAVLRKVALGEPVTALDEKQIPYAPIRWINQWDNLDRSIERGYGGRSIFWDNGHVRADLTRVTEYGRLLASLGIDACTIDNVNADPRLLTAAYIPEVARIAEAFRPWGVRVALSVDFGSPQSVGGLDTFDPLDPRVADWWKQRAEEVYRAIPDLAGFVLKADSEGRAGPSKYGRTHADAANMVARALKPHGGLLLYRGFVYDHHMDWRNPKNDRARAAYDNFQPLDGQFDDNAVIQIKNGPIDFQVREPASPLFGALEKTNEALELQVTQEYMGQARHLVFLVPQWKETMDFDLHARGAGTPVKALAAGKTFHRAAGGFVGVTNVGLEDNWFGNQMSQANLYGFGRLAWDPDLTSGRIADEWTRQTFGGDPKVVDTITRMLLKSWRAYEDYTGPLGLQTLTDIVGNHYGVSVEASERNGWGQWHRADEHGVGMDRTVATGTGYIGQYRPPVAALFESLETCPDNLLLFFHHVPYTHLLHGGKTVIQYIYDAHYEGEETVAEFVKEWAALKASVDEERYMQVLAQLEYQDGQAEVWRDAVNNWFLRESGIPDAKGRVGHHPGRVEAEDMHLNGYRVVDVTPWEAASGGKAIACPAAECSASFRYDGADGKHTLRVEYFDQNNGASHFRLFVANQLVAEWTASDRLPTRKMDGTSSTRRSVPGVALHSGDEIRIEGAPDGGEPAGIDYIEVQ
jgi:alpha-glucuronidase